MKFIYADCLDYIDPNYDFREDTSNKINRRPYWDDLYAHEYLTEPPYDGILVSRAIIGSRSFPGKYTESQALRFRLEGARAFLRYHKEKFPESLVFGDCGAFQYHTLSEPPYTPEEIIEFYDDSNFSHGCSIDHIIFDFQRTEEDHLPSDDVMKRYEITLDLAQQFIKLARPLEKKFTPLGVIQGWSPKSMASAAQRLVGMGYKYLAVGGLVPLSVDDIHIVLRTLKDALDPRVKLHLLGFAKADNLAEFFRYDVTSFDTTSPLLRAFKDGKRNYYKLEQVTGLDDSTNHRIEYYQAIRIPQANENKTLLKLIKKGVYGQEEIKIAEARALEAIRSYASCPKDLEGALDAIIAYSKYLVWKEEKSSTWNENNLEVLRISYRRTLQDAPWKSCSCRVCKDAGVETIIFRSSNRNKRRGIHNLNVYNMYLKKLLNMNKRDVQCKAN